MSAALPRWLWFGLADSSLVCRVIKSSCQSLDDIVHVPMSFFTAPVSSTYVARFSVYFFLSAFACFFTSLSNSEYVVLCCCFRRSDLASISFFFTSFLSSIFFHVPADIHVSFVQHWMPRTFYPTSMIAWLKVSIYISC